MIDYAEPIHTIETPKTYKNNILISVAVVAVLACTCVMFVQGVLS